MAKQVWTWKTNHGDIVTVWSRQVQNAQKWRWNVKAANGEIVEHGEPYTNRVDCMNAALRHHPEVE